MIENANPPQEEMQVRLMKDGPQNVTLFVLGATGSGKSTLMANILDRQQRFVIFDTRKEYDPDFFQGTKPLIVNTPEELLTALNSSSQRIIFRVPLSTGDESLNKGLDYLYHFQERNHLALPPIMVSIDETNRFAETMDWPQWLQEIVQTGRDYKIHKLFGAQWFGILPTWFRDSFSEVYAFRHTDPAGVNLLGRYGFFAEDLTNLPEHTVLYSDKKTVKTIRLVAMNKQQTKNK